MHRRAAGGSRRLRCNDGRQTMGVRFRRKRIEYLKDLIVTGELPYVFSGAGHLSDEEDGVDLEFRGHQHRTTDERVRPRARDTAWSSGNPPRRDNTAFPDPLIVGETLVVYDNDRERDDCDGATLIGFDIDDGTVSGRSQ